MKQNPIITNRLLLQILQNIIDLNFTFDEIEMENLTKDEADQILRALHCTLKHRENLIRHTNRAAYKYSEDQEHLKIPGS